MLNLVGILFLFSIESNAVLPSGSNVGLPNSTIRGRPITPTLQGTSPSITPNALTIEPLTAEGREQVAKEEDDATNARGEASTGETCSRKMRRCGRNAEFSSYCNMVGIDVPHDCVTDVRYKQCVQSCTELSENECSGDERKSLAHLKYKCTNPKRQPASSETAPLVQQQFPAPQGFYDVNPASTEPAPNAAPTPASLPVVGPTPVPRPEPPTPAPHIPLPPTRPAHLGQAPEDVNPGTPSTEAPRAAPSNAQTEPAPTASPSSFPSASPSGPSFYIPDTSTASRGEASPSELPTLPQHQVDPSSISFNNSSALGGAVPTASDGVSSDGSGGGGSSTGSGRTASARDGTSGRVSSDGGGGFQTTAGAPSLPGASAAPTPLRPSASRGGAVNAPNPSRAHLPGFNSQYHRPPAAVSSYRPSYNGRSSSSATAVKKASGPSSQTIFSRIRGRVDARYAQAQPRVPASSGQRNHELGQGIHSVFEQVVQRANHFQLDHNGNLKNP